MTTLTSSISWLVELNRGYGVSVEFEVPLWNCWGTFSPVSKRISISKQVAGAEVLVTLVHETIHVLQEYENVLKADVCPKTGNIRIPCLSKRPITRGGKWEGYMGSYLQSSWEVEIPAHIISLEFGFAWFQEWYEAWKRGEEIPPMPIIQQEKKKPPREEWQKQAEFLQQVLYGHEGLTCVKKRASAWERLSSEDQDLALYG